MKPDELKKRRETIGLTQSQLAHQLGVDMMTVSRWERGVHTIPKHIELAVELIEQRQKKLEAA